MRIYKHVLVLPPASLELLERPHELWVTVSLPTMEKGVEAGFLSSIVIL